MVISPFVPLKSTIKNIAFPFKKLKRIKKVNSSYKPYLLPLNFGPKSLRGRTVFYSNRIQSWNPEFQVLYLVQSLSLKTELALKGARVINFLTPVRPTQLQFFETLPLARIPVAPAKYLTLNLLSQSFLVPVLSFYLIFRKHLNPFVVPNYKNLIALSKYLFPNFYYFSAQQKWTLRRLLNKKQILGGVFASVITSKNFFEIWKVSQILSLRRTAKSTMQTLYHVRRVLDKIDTLSDSDDKQKLLSYYTRLHKLVLAKSVTYRLISLKNLVRKSKHRRIVRWSLFPRNYLKIKTDSSTARPKVPSSTRTLSRGKTINRNKNAF